MHDKVDGVDPHGSRVNVPIKLTKIYIETFLVHKILVSVQKVMLKQNINLSQKYLILF